MLLKFYLVSTVMCWIVAYVSAKAIDEKLKRKGRKRKETKYSFFEKIQTSLPLLIPLFNLFLMFIFIFKFDELLDKAMKESITVPISEQ